MKINKQDVKKYAGFALLIGKEIVIEGTKAVFLQAMGIGMTKFMAEGKSGVKTLTLNDYLGNTPKEEKRSVVYMAGYEAGLKEGGMVAKYDED